MRETQLLAERSCSITGEVKTVQVSAYLQYGFQGTQYLHIRGGPTGSEAVSVDKLGDLCEVWGGWLACQAAKGRWDGLWVSAEELARVRKELGV